MTRLRSVFILSLVAFLPNVTWGLTLPVQYPLLPSELVFTEFFDDLFRMLPLHVTPTVIPNAHAVSGPIAVDQNGMILFIDDTDRLSRFDPTTSIITPINAPIANSSFNTFALESATTSLVLNGDDLLRIDMTTGGVSGLVNGDPLNGGYFSPNDVVVTSTGRVFLTEFFESLWEINPVSGAASVVSLDVDLFPQAIAAFSDGDLLIRDFSPARLVRVDPDTGDVSLFSDALPTFVRDYAVLANDDVVLTGVESGLGVVYRYNSTTGQRMTLYQHSPFFSPQTIAVAPGPVPVPEPASVLLVATLLAFCGGRLLREC